MPQDKNRKFPMEIKAGGVRVKIYRVVEPNRERFTLVYHDGPVRRLKQFSDFGEAWAEARITAERLNAGQGDALRLTGQDRDRYLYAVRKIRPLGITLPQAVDEYTEAKKLGVPLLPAAKYYRQHHHTELPSKLAGDVVKEFLEAKKADGRSAIYIQDCKNRLERFSQSFKTNLKEITTRELDAWLRSLKVSSRTRNNFRTVLCSLFSFAKAAGYLAKDRATEAEMTARAKTGQTEIQIFTPQEFAAILSVCDDVLKPFVVIGGFSGLRSAEILRLKWENIRWESSQIEVGGSISKTRTRRMAPLTAPAIAWLKDFKDRRGLVISKVKLYERLRALAFKAGLDEEWRDNALRHSFGTYRMAELKNPAIVAYEMGNSPGIVKSSYDAVVTEREAKLWFSIMPEQAGNVVAMKGAA